MSWLARSPSLVRMTSPSLSLSSRPAQKRRWLANSLGRRSNTVRSLCGSSLLQMKPLGLLMQTVSFAGVRKWTGFPLKLTRSTPGSILAPSSAVLPFTDTIPSLI